MDNRSEDKGEVGSRDLFRFLKCPSHSPGSRLTGGQGGVENRKLEKPSSFRGSHPVPKLKLCVVLMYI